MRIGGLLCELVVRRSAVFWPIGTCCCTFGVLLGNRRGTVPFRGSV